jgi:uncharacterized protein YndB with AHSA1/START domain
MNTDPIIIEKSFDSKIDVVWKAITDKDEMKKWYFHMSDFKPEVGFEFQFEGKSEKSTYIHNCRVIEVIPGRKLTHTWSYEGYEGLSFLTIELSPDGPSTIFRLTHEGVDTFPQDDPDFSRESFEAGWKYIIGTSLKEYLERT